jgi:hypothetical protein
MGTDLTYVVFLRSMDPRYIVLIFIMLAQEPYTLSIYISQSIYSTYHLIFSFHSTTKPVTLSLRCKLIAERLYDCNTQIFETLTGFIKQPEVEKREDTIHSILAVLPDNPLSDRIREASQVS